MEKNEFEDGLSKYVYNYDLYIDVEINEIICNYYVPTLMPNCEFTSSKNCNYESCSLTDHGTANIALHC